MGRTLHDIVKSALVKEAMKEGDSQNVKSIMTPEKYQRMWEKITGKAITLNEAKKTLKQG